MQSKRLPGCWVLWLHRNEDTSWEDASYVKVYRLDTVAKFWSAFGVNERRVDGISSAHILPQAMFFLMREGVMPRWEDPANVRGGCFSIKMPDKDCILLLEQVACAMLGETLTKDYQDARKVMGMSIVLKQRKFMMVKIWVSDLVLCKAHMLALPAALQKGVVFLAHEDSLKKQQR